MAMNSDNIIFMIKYAEDGFLYIRILYAGSHLLGQNIYQ